MRIKLETKDNETLKKLVDYLEANASDELVEKINNGTPYTKDGIELINKKDLIGFMRYAVEEAKKVAEKGATGTAVISTTVFGWLMHYFQEDEIVGTLYNLDGSEYKPVVKTTTVKTPVVTTKPVVKKKDNDGQMSLFDAFDEAEQNPPVVVEETVQDVVVETPPVAQENPPRVVENVVPVVEKPTGNALFQEYSKFVEQYPGCAIAYRVGDFYEVFGKNAVAISNELDLTLTSREMGLDKRLPMIGFPYHCAERYFEEIAKKHKLVIVEDHKATEYVDEVDAFEADLDTLQEMEQNNVSVAQLEEYVDCDENGVVKDDDYKVLQTLSELLGVNVILR